MADYMLRVFRLCVATKSTFALCLCRWLRGQNWCMLHGAPLQISWLEDALGQLVSGSPCGWHSITCYTNFSQWLRCPLFFFVFFFTKVMQLDAECMTLFFSWHDIAVDILTGTSKLISQPLAYLQMGQVVCRSPIQRFLGDFIWTCVRKKQPNTGCCVSNINHVFPCPYKIAMWYQPEGICFEMQTTKGPTCLLPVMVLDWTS